MKDKADEKEFKMPGVGLDSSNQLDELLSELLKDSASSSKDSKRWENDGWGDGQSGGITTQSGNSRTIISWQTNQSGPKKSVTVTKQLTGGSNWNGELGSSKTSEKFLEGSSNAVEYQKNEFRSSTMNREDALNSSASLNWKESSCATLGKTSKTPPPPPVRRRLTSVDELRMEALGCSTETRTGSRSEDSPEMKDLTRNCASDTEETRSWLDEQIWKLQAKKSDKSYQQHTRLEKRLIADLKNRLGLGGKEVTQSDIEDGLVRLADSSQQKTSNPSPHQRNKDSSSAHTISISFDDVMASKSATSNTATMLNQTQSDTDTESILVTSPKHRTFTLPPNGSQTLSSSSVRVFQTASDNEVTPAASAQSTLKREPVRSLSLGDDASRPNYKTKASFYVSGIERPAFSTHQTKYTFSVNPVLSEDPQHTSKLPPVPPPRSSAPTSPVAPKRGDSSREAVLKSQRKLVCSPTFDEMDNSLRLIMEQHPPTNSSAPEKDRKVRSPSRDIDDEVIVLKPIGPGIQTLEPDSTGTLRRPMTPLIPFHVAGSGDETLTLRKNPGSSSWASAENINSQQSQSSQQSQVNGQYSRESIKKTQLQSNTPMYVAQPLGIGDTNVIMTQHQPWQQQQNLSQQQLLHHQQQQHLQQFYPQQQPWQQQFVQQPLPTQQLVSLEPQLVVQSCQQQTQPWQQQQQQAWQHQTLQQQQRLPMQPQPQQPLMQQSYIATNRHFNQNPGDIQLTSQTTEFAQQRLVQPTITQHGFQPLLVGVANNQQFESGLPQGNNLHSKNQNQQIFVQSAHQDGQHFNAPQQNLQQRQQHFSSQQQSGVQQFSPQTLNAQRLGGQMTASSLQNTQLMGRQNHFYGQHFEAQLNNQDCQLMTGQMANMHPQLIGGQTIQQSNAQQMGAYQSTPQFIVNQGGPSAGIQQERSKYVTVEHAASTLSQNGNIQPNGLQTQVNAVPNTVHMPQQMQFADVQDQRQLMQQQLRFQQEQQQQMQQQQMQQQQNQQQQIYSRAFQSSSAEQIQNGRQGVGSLDNRTKSPVPLGSPSSVGSWPSAGYNSDTLRSQQTLPAKSTGLKPQSMSYETLLRTTSPSLMRAASPASIYNGQFRNGSPTSLTDGMEFANTMPRFVRDTSKYWHKPNISREEAINMLKDKSPGSFVVRNSTTFQGGFGLALKVAQLPPNVQVKGDDPQANLVRHFLIESSSKGVRLKGCSNEPVFGSLAALIYQHSITPLALPCKLLLPTADGFDEADKSDANALHSSVCSSLYVESIDTESLTGPEALSRAVALVFGAGNSVPKATSVQFKISLEGITLTDSKHRLFFRRHYPLNTISFCGMDGIDRRLILNGQENAIVSGKLFGFIARKSGGNSENVCHLFLNPESNQSASSIVDLVTKVMMGQGQFMKN